MKWNVVYPPVLRWSKHEKKKEKIWLGSMTKTDIPTEMSNGQRDNTKTPWKCSITQRLRTDLGQSIEVATTTQLVWLTGLRAQRGEMKFFRLSVLRGSKYEEKKREIWPSPMTKPPISTENSKTKGQHKNATKNFDYTTIADRLRTVRWSNKEWSMRNEMKRFVRLSFLDAYNERWNKMKFVRLSWIQN